MSISPEISRLIAEIREDRTHGASQLARQAAAIIKLTAQKSRAGNKEEFLRQQQEIYGELMQARPAMAPVFNMVAMLCKAVFENAFRMNLAQIRQFVVAKADAAVKNSIAAITRIAEYSLELIVSGDCIMTYSYSSTVMAVLKSAFDKYGNINVIVARSGPGSSGKRTAHELAACGIAVTFIDDAALGLYLSRADKVIFGTDRLCSDGKIVNAAGSYLMAIAAKRAGVPVYVCCETLKFDPGITGAEVDLEETALEAAAPLPKEVLVSSPTFDITPPELVTEVVTEQGRFTPEEVISYIERGVTP